MAQADTTRAGVQAELREARLTGRLVDWRTGDDAADDPAHGAGWDAQRTVDAALLVELLTDAEAAPRPRALRIAGARIVGRLDLEATEVVCPLLLRGCWFAEPVVLDEARAPALRLPGCHLPELSAEQLTTRGNLELNNGFTSAGEVNLQGAHIGGTLDLSGATLTNPEGDALSAYQLTVNQSMLCREGFNTTGAVNLQGAHIGGTLEFIGARLSNPGGYALIAIRLTVDDELLCRDESAVTGIVDLRGAHIGGVLDFGRATLTYPDGDALLLSQLRAGVLLLQDLIQPPQAITLLTPRSGPWSTSRRAGPAEPS